MALVVWPPSADPRDYQEPGRWEERMAAEQEAHPTVQVRPSLRLVAASCYAGGFMGAMEAHGVVRWLSWAIAVVPWGAVVILARIRPAWAMQPRRPAGGSED